MGTAPDYYELLAYLHQQGRSRRWSWEAHRSCGCTCSRRHSRQACCRRCRKVRGAARAFAIAGEPAARSTRSHPLNWGRDPHLGQLELKRDSMFQSCSCGATEIEKSVSICFNRAAMLLARVKFADDYSFYFCHPHRSFVLFCTFIKVTSSHHWQTLCDRVHWIYK